MKARVLAGLAGLAAFLWLLPGPGPAVPVEGYHVAMGTVVRVALFADEDRAPPLFAQAWGLIDRLDSALTHYGVSSEIARLHGIAPGQPKALSEELHQVLAPALELARRTDGAFDPALGALTALWGFPEARRPPAPASIDSALALGGYEQVRLSQGRVIFERAGVRLDLGAAAKGHVVDRTVDLLRAAGVEAGVVEAGGDLRFWGRKPDGRPWRFGVQHPRDPADTVAVEDVGLPALATSGDYELAFESEGRRYHHLLDPATGYPAGRAVSATAWARTALEADALATAAFVAGPGPAMEWAAADDGLEVMVYYEDGGYLRRVHSDGLQGRIQAAPAP
ncbi:MAG: FAD:protein FMN transferase [Gemmatimonadaceae bacterium]|nr:FAD:protein FMN transferase [Gemmatimonadaceae bacterium]